jgi:hypothetical protein
MVSVNRALLPVAIVVSCSISLGALASSCLHEIVVPIRFQQGAVCWRHVGVGTTFKGQFGAGQHVTASAIGEFENSDARGARIATGPWKLSVTGPAGFSADTNDDGVLDALLPQNGEYNFVTYPCAIWGNQGMIEICAQ